MNQTANLINHFAEGSFQARSGARFDAQYKAPSHRATYYCQPNGQPAPRLSSLSIALYAAGLISALLVSMPVMAQPAAPAVEAATTAAKTTELEQVIVTAQKRPETVQKTPLAITAINGEEIRESGIRNLKDLTGLIPNVQINQNAAATEITIRGITSTNNTEIGDPAAGFHVDGVFFGRPEAAGAAFYDVSRVEVLRGPQGTLWGRNTTAGTINVITNKPQNKFEGAAMLEIGNFSSVRTEGMLNIPIADTFAVRGAFTTEKHNGYVNSVNPAVGAVKNTSDAKDTAARLHALYKPNQSFSLLISADTFQQKGAGYGSVPLPVAADRGAAGRRSPANVQSMTDNQYDGFSAELNYDFGAVALTYIGANRTAIRNEINTVTSNTARTQNNTDTGQNTHELRLASVGITPITWVVGAFSYKETNNITLRAFNVSGVGLPPGFGLGFIQPFVESKSTAIFGQATYAVTDALRLTAGIRSTKDDKARRGTNTLMAPSGADVRVLSVNNSAVDSSKINGRLGADYSLNKNTLLYASVATGYKAGGFIDGTKTALFDNTFKPENVTTYEGGFKGRMLNGTLQTNLAIFASDFKDFQVSYRGQLPGGPTGTFVTLVNNAGKASLSGAEAEIRWLVGGGSLDAGVALLRTKFDKFESPPGAVPAFSNTGKELVKAPNVTANLGYQYSWNIFDGEVSARISSRYSGSYFLQPTNAAISEQKSYTKTDLSLTYTGAKEIWFIQGYIKNLENNNVAIGLGGLTAPTAFLAPPRTFGVRAGVKF